MAKKEENKQGKKFNINGKQVVGYAMKVVQELLGLNEEEAAKKATLNDIKMEDAQRGKIRLEHKQNTILAELKEAETQKRKLFVEGAQKASVREQKVLALKIKQLDSRMGNLDRMLETLYTQIRVIDSFIMIKEQEQMNKEMGFQSIFGDMDMNELVVYMEKAMVDGELNMTVLRDLADRIDKNVYSGYESTEDSDIQDIIRQMQIAHEAADSAEDIDTYYEEMNEVLSEKAKERAGKDQDLLEEDQL